MGPVQVAQLARVVGAELRAPADCAARVSEVCTDSRWAVPGAVFVALPGARTDGHRFLAEAFVNGSVAAIVEADKLGALDTLDPSWPLIVVDSALRALQQLAAWHRRERLGKVLAITGSNGKTVVKNALARLLAGQPHVSVSPGSYNSQIGLPLAVLEADDESELTLIEAGISEPGEMRVLEQIARPDFGILTNVGLAHLAAFGSREAIGLEKLELFRGLPASGWLIAPPLDGVLGERVGSLACTVHTLDGGEHGPVSLTPLARVEGGMIVRLSEPSGAALDLRVGTRSRHMLDNLRCAVTAARLLGVSLEQIAALLRDYEPPPTRMEIWTSTNGVSVINDTHSSDPLSVRAALDLMADTSARGRKLFVFAGMHGLGADSEREHRLVGTLAAQSGVDRLCLLRSDASTEASLRHTAAGYADARRGGQVAWFEDSASLRGLFRDELRTGDAVLLKGPRNAPLGRAARELYGSQEARCLWVELEAVRENVARLERHCKGARILAMLKALAYGSGLVRLATWLAGLGIHDFGVSTTEEGVALRKAGLDHGTRILVFLAHPSELTQLVHWKLTPVLYSREITSTFIEGMQARDGILDVHLKVDTGMHRLGVAPEHALDTAERIRACAELRLRGLCTHFAAADDPAEDDFTRGQIARFEAVRAELERAGFELEAHAANSAAAMRFPEAHYDMCRIGIGLYGVSPLAYDPQAPDAPREPLPQLELALSLTSQIVSVRECAAGESVGYSRAYRSERPMRLGVVPFGYEDGMPWRLWSDGSGQGGFVIVAGQRAPIVGRVSMDQMIIDLSGLEGVGVGTQVLLFGARGADLLRPEQVAALAGTSVYELLVRVGQRVHRVYTEP